MRKLLVIIAALALTLTGCASKNDESGYSAQETMFASMMIPHHQQAIVMSDLALSNTSNPDVLALAEQIKAAQEPEIAQMKKWGDVDTHSHMGHVMSGMLTDDEIETLKNSRDLEFDRLFLEGMIKHHEGAITMTEMIDESDNPEVRALAQTIVTTQRAEIDKMRALLTQ
jgi:uncharacterized protein (DUF305 family)